MPLVLFILGMSYQMNQKRSTTGDPPLWEMQAEEVYEYVRDAMFLVFRDVSEYTNIVRPSSPSAIEFSELPYSIEDGYVAFNFIDKICGPVDIAQLKIDLRRTLRQKHRANEFNGISRDLVQINGSWYCPLQILGKPQDFGDHVRVSIVFATEKTIVLTNAQKVLNLDNIGDTRRPQSKELTDNEL